METIRSVISIAVVLPGISGLSLGAKLVLNLRQISHGWIMKTELQPFSYLFAWWFLIRLSVYLFEKFMVPWADNVWNSVFFDQFSWAFEFQYIASLAI